MGTQLVPLTSIRFFAALHILLFHIHEGHRVSEREESGFALPVFDELPRAMINWLRHGYFSTSLFFLISGFILAYLYILPDGRLSVSARSFWIARATRIYPVHILILILAAPAVAIVAWNEQKLLETTVSGLLSAALLQAWFPPYALSWNFPTWALSTVAFFYLAFPPLASRLGCLSRRQLALTLSVLPLLSLLPSIVFLMVYPDGGEPLSFWHEFVMRTPLFWIPHFLMGMLLARLFSISRFDHGWRSSARGPMAWGDVAFLAVVVLSVSRTPVPDLLLRHGLLAPLYLVMILDLAKGRGMLARVLSLPGMKALGDASFSIFMLQLLGMILVMIPAYFVPLPSSLVVILIVAVTIALSLLSTNYFEKPIATWLRSRVEGR